MATTEPIKNIKQLEEMKKYLLNKDIKIGTMFIVGANVLLRVSDLLNMRWGDILAKDKKTFKDWKLVEMKTKKSRTIKLNKACTEALTDYMETLEHFELDDYVFASKENNTKAMTSSKFLSEINYVLARGDIKLDKVNQDNIKKLNNNILLPAISKKLFERNYMIFIIFNLVIKTEHNLNRILSMTVEDYKNNTLNLSAELLKLFNNKFYIEKEGYIFKAHQGKTKPYTRNHVWALIKEASETVGITDNIGTHTWRKTWVWNAVEKNVSPARIMQMGNWSSWEVAKAYSGITQDEISQTYDEIVL